MKPGRNLPGHDSINRLIIGTAQLGLSYGVANKTHLDHTQKLDLLDQARQAGITCFDTARAYGKSENVLGDFVRAGLAENCDVVTKLAPLEKLSEGSSKASIEETVRASVNQSRSALRMPQLGTFLLHRAKHLYAWDSFAWETVLRLRDEGLIRSLGVSVQSPEDLRRSLHDENVSYIQMPFNLLDHRWSSSIDAINDMKKQRPLKVVVRSVYLQGLFLSQDDAVWKRAHVQDHTGLRHWIENMTARLGRNGIDDLCLAYANGQKWIDGIVIGIDNKLQLARNVDLIRQPALTASEIDSIVATRPNVEIQTLDPSMWQGTNR